MGVIGCAGNERARYQFIAAEKAGFVFNTFQYGSSSARERPEPLKMVEKKYSPSLTRNASSESGFAKTSKYPDIPACSPDGSASASASASGCPTDTAISDRTRSGNWLAV